VKFTNKKILILIVFFLTISFNLVKGVSQKDNSKMTLTFLGKVYVITKTEFYGKFERVSFLSGGIEGTKAFIEKNGKNTNNFPSFQPAGNEEKDISRFEDILKKIISNYTSQGMEEKDILRAALDGMLHSLKDPYTIYMDPRYYEQYNQAMGASDYSGIGIFIELDTKNNNHLTIVEPIEETPAYRAGLRPGDEIIEINGVETKGIDIDRAANLIKGPEESILVLKIKRKKASRPIEFEITRTKIHVNSVATKTLDNNIGLIRIRIFGETTKEEFERALQELNGAKGLIIDLRNNGGGLVKAAIGISSHFIPKGKTIVTIKEKKQEVVEVSEGFPAVTKPVIILVNKYTASASEITSGALQDYGIAVLVGDNTFGKGCVQSITELKGEGALKITIANYFTPKGRAIHNIGLKPDINIEMDEYLVGREKKDIQLKKAVELLKNK